MSRPEAGTRPVIGVAAGEARREAVAEFFELFKTPWEPLRPDRRYGAAIVAGDRPVDQVQAELVMIYGRNTSAWDRANGLAAADIPGAEGISGAGVALPLYGGLSAFEGSEGWTALQEWNGRPVVLSRTFAGRTVRRHGYDLFAEVEHLLTAGQPPRHAAVPALDIHIDLLRRAIVAAGLPLVEIPPAPAGREFAACLTHDVDFAGVRDHVIDRSLAGFAGRAALGSLRRFARGDLPLGRVLANWGTLLRLPLICAGLGRDCWDQFARYREMETDGRSTFFFIPFAGRPGRDAGGRTDRRRAARYDVGRLGGVMDDLRRAGHEIGVHGIDAWRDTASALAERARIETLTGDGSPGVRMHWLFQDGGTFRRLDEAGFDYDSSFGFNETAGFRAGTAQVFRPLGSRRLLELPLHIQDTTLFQPRRMGLRVGEAWRLCRDLMDTVALRGGVLTINWHQRSLGPERWWDRFYGRLLDDLRGRGAWMACGRRAVDWFRARRDAIFESDGSAVRLRLRGRRNAVHPPLAVRTYPMRAAAPDRAPEPASAPRPSDRAWTGAEALEIRP